MQHTYTWNAVLIDASILVTKLVIEYFIQCQVSFVYYKALLYQSNVRAPATTRHASIASYKHLNSTSQIRVPRWTESTPQRNL